jgi:hypothetical protein
MSSNCTQQHRFHRTIVRRNINIEKAHDDLNFVQLLASLKSRVTDLENAVTGFNKTIEELRAAGRVEAMEDLMTNLLGQLVCCHPPMLSCLNVRGKVCKCVPYASQVFHVAHIRFRGNDVLGIEHTLMTTPHKRNQMRQEDGKTMALVHDQVGCSLSRGY